MQEYLIEIKGLKQGDLTKVALVLMAAGIRDNFSKGIAFLRDSEPSAVIVHPEDVPRAIDLIHALGFETEELSQTEALQSRVRDLERGIKVAHRELVALDKEWGYSEDDPKYKRVIDNLQALLK